MSPGVELSWPATTTITSFLMSPPRLHKMRLEAPIGRWRSSTTRTGIRTRGPRQFSSRSTRRTRYSATQAVAVHTMQKEERRPSVRKRANVLLVRGSITAEARREGEVDMRGAARILRGSTFARSVASPTTSTTGSAATAGESREAGATRGAMGTTMQDLYAMRYPTISAGRYLQPSCASGLRESYPLYSRRGLMEKLEVGTSRALCGAPEMRESGRVYPLGWEFHFSHSPHWEFSRALPDKERVN